MPHSSPAFQQIFSLKFTTTCKQLTFSYPFLTPGTYLHSRSQGLSSSCPLNLEKENLGNKAESTLESLELNATRYPCLHISDLKLPKIAP